MANFAGVIIQLGTAAVSIASGKDRRGRQTFLCIGQGYAFSGAKVDAVVAGAAGRTVGYVHPVVDLRGLKGRGRGPGRVVALGAIPYVLRESAGCLVCDAAVVIADLGQILAHVNLVDVLLQVSDRQAVNPVGVQAIIITTGNDSGFGPAVLALFGVTDHAVFYFIAIAAMEGGIRVGRRSSGKATEALVAFVAFGRGDDIAPRGGRRLLYTGRGNKVEDGVHGICHKHVGEHRDAVRGVFAGAGGVAGK